MFERREPTKSQPESESLPPNLLEQEAAKAVETAGYQLTNIKLIPEGISHHTFTATLDNGSIIIARFEKPQVRITSDGVRRDFLFNGPLSLEREMALANLIREAGLPAPKVYGLHKSNIGPFLLVEKLPGNHWSKYMQESGYSKKAYLNSLQYLGEALARLHQISFSSFGDVMGRDNVFPGTIFNFKDRLNMIIGLNLDRARDGGVLNQETLRQISDYFEYLLNELSSHLNISTKPSVLNLADIHPRNFFVDTQGKPSGFFDLEFCQAAPPEVDIFLLRSMFNYFEGVSQNAEEAFLAGYRKNGGSYDPHEPTTKKLELILELNHLLAAVVMYHNATADPLRRTWSAQYTQILLEAIRDGEVNYAAASDILRSKTGQPKFLNMG